MIRHYIQNGKKYYSVFLKTRDKQGKQINRSRKGIVSERKAREIEYQLLLALIELAGAETPWRFKDWYKECLKRMRLTHKLGTIQGYDGALKAIYVVGYLGRNYSLRNPETRSVVEFQVSFKLAWSVDCIWTLSASGTAFGGELTNCELPEFFLNSQCSRNSTNCRQVNLVFE